MVSTLRVIVASSSAFGFEGRVRLRIPLAVPPACRAIPSAVPATSRASLPALSITFFALGMGCLLATRAMDTFGLPAAHAPKQGASQGPGAEAFRARARWSEP